MAKRDTAAFAEFVAARSPALFRTAYVMVGDHGLAQDLVQEALTKTYVAWPKAARGRQCGGLHAQGDHDDLHLVVATQGIERRATARRRARRQ